MNQSLIDSINKLWWPDGHLNEDQRDFLIELLQGKNPNYCIETGFATGRSAVTTLCAANPKTLVSIDINLDYMGARSHATRLQEDFPNFKVIESDTAKILNESFFRDNFSNGIDFAFIDGSHTYDGALFDMMTISSHLNAGGIMVVDDYRSGPPNGCTIPDVDKAVSSFAKSTNLSFTSWSSQGKGFGIFEKVE